MIPGFGRTVRSLSFTPLNDPKICGMASSVFWESSMLGNGNRQPDNPIFYASPQTVKGWKLTTNQKKTKWWKQKKPLKMVIFEFVAWLFARGSYMSVLDTYASIVVWLIS